MNKEQFLKELEDLLQDIDATEREEALFWQCFFFFCLFPVLIFDIIICRAICGHQPGC